MRQPQPKEITWVSQFGGVYQSTPGERIPLGAWSDALNHRFTLSGELTARPGAEKIVTEAGGLPIISEFMADFDGTIRRLVATMTKVYELLDNDTLSLLYTFPTSHHRPTFAQLLEASSTVVVFGNGKDRAQKWDGSTVSDCVADTPNGRPIVWSNYLGFFDIDGYPGLVQFAIAPNDPDSWYDINGDGIYLYAVGQVTSAYPYAGGLIVFTVTRADFYTGDPGLGFAPNPLSKVVGCVEHFTVVDCDGLLFWVGRGGGYVWDGGGVFPSDLLTSPHDNTKSNIGEDARTFTWEDMTVFSSAYLPAKKQLWLSGQKRPIPGGDIVNRTWIYFFDYAAWMPWDLEARSLSVYAPISGMQEEILMGSVDGSIRKLAFGTYSDVSASTTTEYQFYLEAGDLDMGAPNHEKTFRGIHFHVRKPEGDLITAARTIHVQLMGDFLSDIQQSGDVDITSPGFILGVSILGTDALAPFREDEKFIRFGIRTKHFRFKIFGEGADNAAAISSLGLELRGGPKKETLVRSA
jgi:hypothetical protein